MGDDEILIQKIANLELDILKCNLEGFGEYLGETTSDKLYLVFQKLIEMYITKTIKL